MRASRAGSWLDDDQRSGRSRARSAMQLALSSNLTLLLLLSLILSLQLTFLNLRKKSASLSGMYADDSCPGYRIVSHYFVVIIGMLLGDAQSHFLLPSLVSFG
jgi:hypothetical protein